MDYMKSDEAVRNYFKNYDCSKKSKGLKYTNEINEKIENDFKEAVVKIIGERERS